MRRTSSNNLFSLDIEPAEYNARLLASIEEEIKNKVDTNCVVNIQLTEDNTKQPVLTIALQTAKFAKTYNYAFMKYKKTDVIVKAFCSDFLCDYLDRVYPQLLIQSINSQHDYISYYNKNMYSINSPVKVSECIDFKSGKFNVKKFIDETGIKADGVPDVIELPLVLSDTQIERGIDPKNVLYSDLNPGLNYAVFVTGEDEHLGGWKTAKRMSFVRDRWRYTLPEGVSKTEYKFMIGLYSQGKEVSVTALKWDEGLNKQISLSCHTPRFGY